MLFPFGRLLRYVRVGPHVYVRFYLISICYDSPTIYTLPTTPTPRATLHHIVTLLICYGRFLLDPDFVGDGYVRSAGATVTGSRYDLTRYNCVHLAFPFGYTVAPGRFTTYHHVDSYTHLRLFYPIYVPHLHHTTRLHLFDS